MFHFLSLLTNRLPFQLWEWNDSSSTSGDTWSTQPLSPNFCGHSCCSVSISFASKLHEELNWYKVWTNNNKILFETYYRDLVCATSLESRLPKQKFPVLQFSSAFCKHLPITGKWKTWVTGGRVGPASGMSGWPPGPRGHIKVTEVDFGMAQTSLGPFSWVLLSVVKSGMEVFVIFPSLW